LQILQLGIFLKRKGHNCYLISGENGPIINLAEKNGISFAIEPFLYLPAVYNVHPIAAELTKFKPDIVFVNTILGDPIIQEIKKYDAKLPVVWIIHESERSHILNAYNYLSEKSFKLSDAVVFVSEQTRKIYNDLDNGNFFVIHNGLDLDKIDSFRRRNSSVKLRLKYGIPADAKVITSIGSIIPRKGQLELAESGINILRNNNTGKNIHFVLVGRIPASDVLYADKIKTEIKSGGFGSNFHIFGETCDVYDFFLMTDIFVCDSFIESFPLVVLEAMAFGLPIIASDVYGIKEQIEDKKSGLLFLPGNRTMLSNLINKLIDDPVLAEELGCNACDRVRNRFNNEIMFSKYLQLINQVM